MTAAPRPVIGICAVRERARWAFWNQDAHLVADSYVAPLQRAGGVVMLLPVDARASLAAGAVGEQVHVARCHHHQAVLNLGDGLVVTGRAASDGVTEAIELADGHWALGVQWHPEADDRSRLFGALLGAAREYTSGPSAVERIISRRPGASGSRTR